MGKINVLTFEVANLIAAGEVVDRPASVVKELIENAIDAGASNITVEIKRGGVTFIRVADDGCGMSREDLPLAVRRHATSKIADANDLENIITLGFRGEALAATAAVSKLRIITKQHGADFGFRLESEGGSEPLVTETGCPVGTTVIVEELFFNVPARRKFLKKDSTEMIAVTGVVEKSALSHPEIAFRYISDGEMKLSTSGDGKLYSAIYAVWGRDCAKRLAEVERSEGGISVRGYTSEPDYIRSNRNMQVFFINGRFVKSRTASAALEQAYISRIPQERFPACVLNIEINPALVDVNVHPSKLEVKFTNERVIFDAVYYAVLGALERESVRPEFNITSPRGEKTRISAEQEAAVTDRFIKLDAKASNRHPDFWASGKKADDLVRAFAAKGERGAEQITLPIREKSAVATPASQESANTDRTASASAVSFARQVGGQHEMSSPAFTDYTQKAAVEEPAEKREPSKPYAPREDEIAENVPEYKILGEAYNCYIIVQLSDRLLIIDKHAAHERIIYNDLSAKLRNAKKYPQILMIPLELSLDREGIDALGEFGGELRQLGFSFSVDRSRSVISVSEIPEELNRTGAAEMLTVLASRLSTASPSLAGAAEEFFDRQLFQASCKAAIKGGIIYGEDQIKWICDKLLVEPEKSKGGSAIKTCPHGRPVAFEIKKSSIERQFERTGFKD